MRKLPILLAVLAALSLSGCISAGEAPQPTATVTVTPAPEVEVETVGVVPQECLETIVYANKRSAEFDELVDLFAEGLEAADLRDVARLEVMVDDFNDLLTRAEQSGESYKSQALECGGIAESNGQDLPDALYRDE